MGSHTYLYTHFTLLRCLFTLVGRCLWHVPAGPSQEENVQVGSHSNVSDIFKYLERSVILIIRQREFQKALPIFNRPGTSDDNHLDIEVPDVDRYFLFDNAIARKKRGRENLVEGFSIKRFLQHNRIMPTRHIQQYSNSEWFSS